MGAVYGEERGVFTLLLYRLAVPCDACSKLLNKGGECEKNYTEVVPWMESLTFSRPDMHGPSREVSTERTGQSWDLAVVESVRRARFIVFVFTALSDGQEGVRAPFSCLRRLLCCSSGVADEYVQGTRRLNRLRKHAVLGPSAMIVLCVCRLRRITKCFLGTDEPSKTNTRLSAH